VDAGGIKGKMKKDEGRVYLVMTHGLDFVSAFAILPSSFPNYGRTHH
jgi:hypothetical protein